MVSGLVRNIGVTLPMEESEETAKIFAYAVADIVNTFFEEIPCQVID